MKPFNSRAALAACLLVLALSGCTPTAAVPAQPDSPTLTQRPAAATLTVEEYPIVEDSVDKPTHFEFLERVDPAIREKRRAIREGADRDAVAEINAALAPFGYSLRTLPSGTYGLYRGEELVLNGLREFDLSPVFVNASGTDWFFIAYAEGRGSVMVRSGAVAPWDVSEHLWAPPVYIGDELAWVEARADYGGFRVVKEGQTLYEGPMPEPAVDNPFKRFLTWDGQWATEVAGDVILDGQSLARDKGYDEVFNLRLIKGRPFYFFSQGGKVHINFDGQTLENTYDEVIHYRCCEPAAFNPGSNDRMVWYWARRGEMWHYVEAGVFESEVAAAR